MSRGWAVTFGVGAAAVLLAACGGGTNSGPSTSPTPSPPTSSPSVSPSVSPSKTTPAPLVPTVDDFSVDYNVHCRDAVPVAISWTSTNAKSAAVTVDNVTQDSGLPPNGADTVTLDCVTATHKVGVVVTAMSGSRASVADTVRIIADPTPTPMPDVLTLSLDPGHCVDTTLPVQATYTTVGATVVWFELDGNVVGAKGDLPLSGTADVPGGVPCDGNSHQVSLVASNDQGNSSQQSRTVGELLQ